MVEIVEREGEGKLSMECRLYQGDCYDIVQSLSIASIDCIMTDIPYNISRDNNIQTMKDRKGRNGIYFGEWDEGFDVSQLSQLIPLLTKNGSFIIFHAFEQYGEVINALAPYLMLKDKLIWQKTNPMPRNRDRRYVSNIEMASWWVMKNAKWTFNRLNSTYDGCILTYPSESGGGFTRYHPCQKNEQMMEELILRHTNIGDWVLDPFMGSGSTVIAAKQNNRNGVGIDIDIDYCQLAMRRILKETK